MQLNPYLLSLAAPVAAKSARAVAHTAHDLGRGFLNALSHIADSPQDQVAEAESAARGVGQLPTLAAKFRRWLADNGISSSFDMKFHLADDGEPVTNVTGLQSERIVDLLHSDAGSGWLERLTEFAKIAESQQKTSAQLPGLHGYAVHEASTPPGIAPRATVVLSSDAEKLLWKTREWAN